MTLMDPYVVHEKSTHAMTLVVVHEKNTHAMVDPYAVCEKNTHAMTLVDHVVYDNNTDAMNSSGSMWFMREHTSNKL